MTHIDLFSGIGGFALAARWAGFHTVCFVEIDKYAQQVIRKNFGAVAYGSGGRREGEFYYGSGGEIIGQERLQEHSGAGRFPRIYSDIRTFDGTAYRGATLLTGGFPCQPFSQAGKRAGTQDDRHLWPEMLRVIREARPAWVVGENVTGLVTMELDNVLSDLEGEGYGVQAFVIPACAVDARHRRDRVWIVAHRDSGLGESAEQEICAGRYAADIVGHADDAGRGERRRAEPVRETFSAAQCAGEDVADTCKWRQQRDNGRWTGPQLENGCEWLPEPDVGRVAHGVSHRVDRLKGLGNAIVPQVAYEILRGIAEIEH